MKGQFFIFSAVVVILALYSISDSLSRDWRFEVSDIQEDNTVWILEEIEYGLNKTIQTSRDNEVDENLNAFISKEKEMLFERGYSLIIIHNSSGLPEVTAELVLDSERFHIEKRFVFNKQP